VRIEAVQQVEVDVIGLQSVQARFDGAQYVEPREAVSVGSSPQRVYYFSAQHDFVALVFERFADDLFRTTLPINCRVDKGAPQFDGAIDYAYARGLVVLGAESRA
jgi:hypothetical protein